MLLSAFVKPASPWILGVLSLPHIYYAILWTFPELWLSFSGVLSPKVAKSGSKVALGNEACKYMANAAHLLKLIQFAALYSWLRENAPASITLEHFRTQHPMLLLGGALCLLVGQAFNAGIYNAIGKNGVYYGNKFGAQLGPWHVGFPFNFPGPPGRHPQYFGVIVTILGMTLLLWTEAAAQAGLGVVVAIWSSYYFVTALVEMTEDTNRDVDGKTD